MLVNAQHDLAVSVACCELGEGVADLVEREGARDRNLEAAIRDQVGELSEQWRGGDRVGTLRRVRRAGQRPRSR